MAKFRITTPDGATYDVTAPDGASEAEVLARVQAEHANGGTSSQPETSFGLGLYKGGWKPFDRLAEGSYNVPMQTLAGMSTVGDSIDAGRRMFGLQGMKSGIAEHRQHVDDRARQGVVPSKSGEFIGNVASTLPLMAVTKNPALLGGLSAPLTSDSETVNGVLGDAVQGMVGGKVGDAALGVIGKGLSGILSPKVSPNVSALLNENIPLTIGQTMGGPVKAIEDKATSLPIVGDAINAARHRTTVALNRAALNRALAPVGETLPKHVNVGRQGVDYVASRLGEKYDALLPNLSASPDPQFMAEMQSIVQDAAKRLPLAQQNRLKTVLSAQFPQKAATPNQSQVGGMFNGDTIKGIEAELGRLKSGFGADSSFDNRELGDIIGDVQTAVRGMVSRQNPQHATELAALNRGWANFARVRRAASSVGADDGVFTAPQLASAVKASDKSAGKGAYARGNALMQDLSDPARSLLPSKVPDSGTAGRVLLNTGGLGSYFLDPSIPAGLMGGAALYSRPGQAALRALVSKRPAWAPAAADSVQQIIDAIRAHQFVAPASGIIAVRP